MLSLKGIDIGIPCIFKGIMLLLKGVGLGSACIDNGMRLKGVSNIWRLGRMRLVGDRSATGREPTAKRTKNDVFGTLK